MYRQSPRLLLAASLGLTALAAACSSDDDAMSSTACAAYADMQAAMFGDPAAMAPAIEALAAAAPDSLSDHAEALAGAADDPAAMEDPAVTSALQEIGERVYDDCDADEKLDVSGVDYAFADLPKEIEAGRVAIRFTNDSTKDEPHELVIVTGTDGQSAAELASLPIDELFAQARPLAVAFTDVPDQRAVTVVDLAPGEYVVICTLPVGGFTDGQQDGPPSDPHSAHGMVTTLTVV